MSQGKITWKEWCSHGNPSGGLGLGIGRGVYSTLTSEVVLSVLTFGDEALEGRGRCWGWDCGQEMSQWDNKAVHSGWEMSLIDRWRKRKPQEPAQVQNLLFKRDRVWKSGSWRVRLVTKSSSGVFGSLDKKLRSRLQITWIYLHILWMLFSQR